MQVPFLDLKSQYARLKPEINGAIQQVLDSCAFAGGPFVEEFEKDFSAYCRCKFAIGVGSGTDALWLALLALGIGPGDEVITVSNTFIATAEAITYCGAKPVFVDIDEKTYTMDPNLVEDAITRRTKAIIPVHLYGQPADMDPIMEIARRHGLRVIEDACQAHGSEYKGKPAGSIGDVGCFSFYPGKNLGAYGEAGAVVTNDEGVRNTICMLRDHGQEKKYHHALVGWNARMDGIQAAVLRVKLKMLPSGNLDRRRHADAYRQRFEAFSSVHLPAEADYATHVYHLFVIRVQNRNEIIQKLAQRQIICGIHYPVPLHLQEAYISLGLAAGSLPVSESCARQIVSLPMYPELSEPQIDCVASELSALLSELPSEQLSAARA